jgi:hypothetical protein
LNESQVWSGVHEGLVPRVDVAMYEDNYQELKVMIKVNVCEWQQQRRHD